MIPRVIHFVYVGGRPFSFIHFLAVYSAWWVNRPQAMILHLTEEPNGPWWERAKPLLQLDFVAPVREVQGNPVHYPAHQADVIRLQVLREQGGIYLDLDVISLRPFDPLLANELVMGIEPGTGLCNAVILAQPQAPFLQQWQAAYRDFDGSRWNYHSVILPGLLAQQMPERIALAGKYDFFYPSHNDPVCAYLWGERPAWGALLLRLGKNLLRLVQCTLTGDRDPVRLAMYRTFHGLRSPAWHRRQLGQAYCLHLWEGLWGKRYLDAVTPHYLREADSHFAQAIRQVLPAQVLAEWCAVEGG